MMQVETKFTPTEFIAITNQTLEYAFSSVMIEGEIGSFKVNQGKWVFFDIKDKESSISCFMTLCQLRMPLEDGMKVVVRGVPKVTKWGKFSFTVQNVMPVGDGNLKKAYELLKKKLTDEGLFDLSRKRKLPEDLTRIGVISSTSAAGYADFIKILNARWGGLQVKVAHTQVQGLDAPDQIIRALNYFNEHSNVQVIAILRGGGSADDLACFNDELLVRSVAASKIPVITGIGHEIDESLCDLAADIRASTPSNAAEMLTPKSENMKWGIAAMINEMYHIAMNQIGFSKKNNNDFIVQINNLVNIKLIDAKKMLENQIQVLSVMDPERVLKQGYAILKGKISPGNVVKITTYNKEINAEIKDIYERK